MEDAGERAVAQLKAAGDVVGLGKLMLDADPWVRVAAADALGEIGDAAAFDALIDCVGSPCAGSDADRARGAARAAMSRLGPPSSEQLRRLVEMGGSGPFEAMELIRQHDLADDPLVGLWYRAATGEWEGGDASRPEALALIVEMLGKPSSWLAAVRGLRAAGAAGVPHLAALLAQRDPPEKRDVFGASLEKDAYAALCGIKAAEAREAAAKHFTRTAAGSDDAKVARCRDGLVAAGGEPALRVLLAELEDERPGRRAAAAEALGALGDPAALSLLVAALDDPHCQVTVLQSAPDSVTDDFLREALRRTREDHPVRAAAEAAIARIRGGAAG